MQEHAEPVVAEDASTQERHGRDAEKPTDLPPPAWKDIAARVRSEAKEDNVMLLSAGVAFYFLLSLVPALVALLSLYGLVADPERIREQVIDALRTSPQEVRDLMSSQLESISESSGGALFAVIAASVVALWSASSGMAHLIAAVNIAYDERETRSFVKKRGLALLFTIGGTIFLMLALTCIAVVPNLAGSSDLGAAVKFVLRVASWGVLFFGMMAGLATLYHYAPNRDDPQWRWTSPGAILATVLWLLASILFSVYTSNFGRYNETYGSLGAIIVLMLWLLITALCVIFGAELNAEMERQTARDTTEGEAMPLGERNAEVADTVGATSAELKSHGDVTSRRWPNDGDDAGASDGITPAERTQSPRQRS
jgi:membrane protein